MSLFILCTSVHPSLCLFSVLLHSCFDDDSCFDDVLTEVNDHVVRAGKLFQKYVHGLIQARLSEQSASHLCQPQRCCARWARTRPVRTRRAITRQARTRQARTRPVRTGGPEPACQNQVGQNQAVRNRPVSCRSRSTASGQELSWDTGTGSVVY